MRSTATRSIGTAQAKSTNAPNTRLPKMAPKRAAARVIDIAVDLHDNDINMVGHDIIYVDYGFTGHL